MCIFKKSVCEFSCIMIKMYWGWDRSIIFSFMWYKTQNDTGELISAVRKWKGPAKLVYNRNERLQPNCCPYIFVFITSGRKIVPETCWVVILYCLLSACCCFSLKGREPSGQCSVVTCGLWFGRGASTTDVDTQGNLPLHRACATGRVHNVTVLLKHAEATSKYSRLFPLPGNLLF